MRDYTVGSLFSGIGGIDLGFERAGFKTVWQVEINDYCRKVLAKHFPSSERYTDVRECGAANLKPVDVIVGGFPCQDISNAGLRAGITGERSGLWSDYVRIIGELRPAYVLVENVAALLGRGMGRVLGDLSAVGYDAEWEIVSAADMGAPHLRERVWILAYPMRSFGSAECRQQQGQRASLADASGAGDVADATRQRCGEEGRLRRGESTERLAGCGEVVADASRELLHRCRELASQTGGGKSPNCGSDVSHANRNDGRQGRPRGSSGDSADGQGKRAQALADSDSSGRKEFHSASVSVSEEFYSGCATARWGENWWAVEPDVGRVAHGVPRRVDRLRGLGNAVVPQIPEMIARRIMDSLIASNEQ